MSVCLLVSANTIEGTASWRTYLTPDGMLIEYSIHIQAKAKMLFLLLKICRFYRQGQYSNAFLAYNFHSLESGHKDTKKKWIAKKKSIINIHFTDIHIYVYHKSIAECLFKKQYD